MRTGWPKTCLPAWMLTLGAVALLAAGCSLNPFSSGPNNLAPKSKQIFDYQLVTGATDIAGMDPGVSWDDQRTADPRGICQRIPHRVQPEQPDTAVRLARRPLPLDHPGRLPPHAARSPGARARARVRFYGNPISLKIACALGWFSPSARRLSVSLLNVP